MGGGDGLLLNTGTSSRKMHRGRPQWADERIWRYPGLAHFEGFFSRYESASRREQAQLASEARAAPR